LTSRSASESGGLERGRHPHRREHSLCRGSRRIPERPKLPVEPADLKLHDCVMLNARNNEADWTWSAVEKRHASVSRADLESRLQFGQHLRVPGHGIGLLPSTYCDEALASGALIRLLPKWASRNPRFRGVLESKIPAFEVDIFLEAWQPEEPAVAQGIRRHGTFAGLDS